MPVAAAPRECITHGGSVPPRQLIGTEEITLAARAADDAILCVSELATNAVLHSNSGQPGGSFTVRAVVRDGGRLRIEVTDQGGPWAPHPDHAAGHGRGLLIVSRLAADWGIAGDGLTSRTAWFELAWPESIPLSIAITP
jgi:two-component sensor histidine kinase